jgi:hypothetical protein
VWARQLAGVDRHAESPGDDYIAEVTDEKIEEAIS